MKYGIQIRKKFYTEIREQAILAEKYGFDSVHVDDHFYSFDYGNKEPYLEAMVLMSAIAVETKKVRIIIPTAAKAW